MFESVAVDRGDDALVRAARIFRVITVLIVAGIILLAVSALVSKRPLAPIPIVFNAALAAVAWVTAGGIEEQKSWARWSGIALGVVELLNIPIGTIIGIAVLVYLNRATKAGLFAKAPAAAPPPPPQPS